MGEHSVIAIQEFRILIHLVNLRLSLYSFTSVNNPAFPLLSPRTTRCPELFATPAVTHPFLLFSVSENSDRRKRIPSVPKQKPNVPTTKQKPTPRHPPLPPPTACGLVRFSKPVPRASTRNRSSAPPPPTPPYRRRSDGITPRHLMARLPHPRPPLPRLPHLAAPLLSPQQHPSGIRIPLHSPPSGKKPFAQRRQKTPPPSHHHQQQQ